jgi:hypothetical protein
LAAEIGAFGLEDLLGTAGALPDRLVALLCVGGRECEWSDFVEVADLVLNIEGRGNLISLN